MGFIDVLFIFTGEIIVFLITLGRKRPTFEGEYDNKTGEYVGVRGYQIGLWIIGLIFWVIAGFFIIVFYIGYILGG